MSSLSRARVGGAPHSHSVRELPNDARLSRGNRITAMFIDSAFGAPIYERLRALGFQNVFEIAFGDPAPDKHYANMRAFMWDRMKDWLATGMIDGSDERLAIDLTNYRRAKARLTTSRAARGGESAPQQHPADNQIVPAGHIGPQVIRSTW